MRSVSQPFLKRPVLTVVCTLLVLLTGLVSLVGLGLEDLPELAPTQVSVRARFPSAAPEVVEQSVTTVLEQQLNGLDGLDSIQSTSSQGQARISLRFKEGDPQLNAIKVQNEVNLAMRRLPQAVTRQGLSVNRSSNDLLMIIGFSHPGDQYVSTFLPGWIEKSLRESLRTLPGIGEVRVFGSSELAYRLWLDPQKLEQANLTVTDVSRALAEQNVLAAIGSIGSAPAPAGQLLSLPVDADGRLRSQWELEEMVIQRLPNGGLMRLRDVGRVALGQRSYGRAAMNLQGERSIAVGIWQRDGANALKLSRAIQTTLERLEKGFPPGITMQMIVDRADTIQANLDRTIGTLRDAVILVLIVLVLFLGRWRLAMVPGITVPISLVGSILLVRLSGSNINSLILFGLVLATGIVVDDAIVVSEEIADRIEKGDSPLEAAEQAMEELSGAVVATSLVLAAVFVPIWLIPGSIGRLYQPIAIAITGAILFSTLNALTFTPMASARVLRSGRGRLPGPIQSVSNRLRTWMKKTELQYSKSLRRVLARPQVMGAVLLVCLVITAISLKTMPTAFIPNEDQGQIRGYFSLPEGASLERSISTMNEIREVISKEPLIRSGNFYAGSSFGQSGEDKGSFFLRLRSLDQRNGESQSDQAIKRRLQSALNQSIKAARVVLFTPPTVGGFSGDSALTVQLLDRSGGQLSLPQFEQVADQFIRIARDSGKFERVGTRFDASSSRWILELDRDQMAALNLPYRETLNAIGTAIGGRYLDDTFADGEIRSIWLQLEGRDRSNPEDIRSLMLRTNDGKLVSASNVADLRLGEATASIDHFALNRSISVSAVPASGISSGQAITLLEEAGEQLGGGNIGLAFTGLAAEERNAEGMTWAFFGLSVVVVYLLLAGLYESFLDPLVILLTVPIALMGALAGLSVRGLPLDVFAQMGLLVLISLAAKNGILIIEFANQRLRAGRPLLEAITDAAEERMRPILLTAITSLAGFVPLLLASGSGSASRISIGTVVFSGLLVSTLLSLFVVPSMYLLLKQRDGLGLQGWIRGTGESP